MPFTDPSPSLADALQHGDADAWRWLFETYSEPLYRYAYHRCGDDPAAAEDIRSETLLAAIEHITGYHGEAPVFGWLCGIARHKAADLARQQGRASQSLDAWDEENDGRAGRDLVDTRPQPEELAANSAGRAEVVRALWSLPEDYRRALIFRYGHGERVDQVACRLQRSYKAVEALLTRARAALRKCLLEMDSDE